MAELDKERRGKRKRSDDSDDDDSELAILGRRVTNLLRPLEEFPKPPESDLERVDRRRDPRRTSEEDELEKERRKIRKRVFVEQVMVSDAETELATSMLRLTLRAPPDAESDIQRRRTRLLSNALEAWSEADKEASDLVRSLWKSAARLSQDLPIDTDTERRIFFRAALLRFLSQYPDKVVETLILSEISRLWLSLPSKVQDIILAEMPLSQRIPFFIHALEAFVFENPGSGFSALRERSVQEWMRCTRPANVDFAPPSFDVDRLRSIIDTAARTLMPANYEPIFEMGDSVWEWLYFTGRFGATDHIEIPLVKRIFEMIYNDMPSMVMSLAWAWLVTHRWPKERAAFELMARGVPVDTPFIKRILG